MDLKTLLSQKCTVLHQQDANGIALIVKESAKYRWFEYGGTSTQSLMNKSLSEEILMPVYQSLLLFLLFKSSPLKILNLGLGGASIERALATISDLLLTSVDSSQVVIDMAKRYFNLPPSVEVFCQQAEQFIEQTDALYDVVLCDLFIGEHNPKFLFKEDFYQQLAKIMVANHVLMINLQADTDEQLIHALLALKAVFPYIAFMEFDDYSNIVIIASSHEIPEQAKLQQQLANFTLLDFSCFLNSSLEQAIEKMRYIPRAK